MSKKRLTGSAVERRLFRAPIWDDVRTLRKQHFSGHKIDIIYGGFPCQDISVAGTGKGLEGERSGLFFEFVRLAKETQARWVFLENSPAIRTRGLNRVVSVLTDLGYDCRWTRVSAAEVGAKHIRERWFLLAHSQCDSGRVESGRWDGKDWSQTPDLVDLLRRDAEPPDNRICDGLPEELDAVKALGNAVVPLQAHEAFKRLIGLDRVRGKRAE